MNEVNLNYNFNGAPVRVVGTWDEPWFVAADVAKHLGYRDAANAVRLLKDKQKGTHLVSTLGGDQELTTISESGLYILILKSRKPEAETFQEWVTEDVLPSIRKTGGYIHDFELFLTHPIMKDLEAVALERITKLMEQLIKHHLTPYLEKKHSAYPTPRCTP